MSNDRYGERQLEILRTIHGPSSPQVASRVASALQVALEQQDWPAAASFGRELLKIRAVLAPAGDAETALATRALGQALLQRNNVEAALPLLQQALQLDRTLHLPPSVLAADQLALATGLKVAGEPARARTQALEALELLRNLEDAGPRQFEAELLLLELAPETGEPGQALPRATRCRQLDEARWLGHAARILPPLARCARALVAEESLASALEVAQAAVELARLAHRTAPPEAQRDRLLELSTYLILLGDLLRRADRLAEVRPLWEEALRIEQQERTPGCHEAAVLLNNLGALCWDLGLHAEGYEQVRQANKLFCELHGFAHPHTVGSGRALILMRNFLEEQQR